MTLFSFFRAVEMAESELWPTCRLLIIDCHERHVGPFGPSTNVVCQLGPGTLLLCMLLLLLLPKSVASWPTTIFGPGPRATLSYPHP